MIFARRSIFLLVVLLLLSNPAFADKNSETTDHLLRLEDRGPHHLAVQFGSGWASAGAFYNKVTSVHPSLEDFGEHAENLTTMNLLRLTGHDAPEILEYGQVPFNSLRVPKNDSSNMRPFRDWPFGPDFQRSSADAAGRGDSVAQYFVGKEYELGLNGKQDYAEAAKWYRKSAEQGHSSAQKSLARLYSSGKGVPKDAAEAYFWELVGDESLQNILAELTPEQKAAAEKRFEKWQKTHPSLDANCSPVKQVPTSNHQ